MATERTERVALLRRLGRNPLVWLIMAGAVLAEPMFAVVFAVVGSWLALWVWVAGVAAEWPPGSPERQRTALVAVGLVTVGLAALLLLLFLLGQASIRAYS